MVGVGDFSWFALAGGFQRTEFFKAWFALTGGFQRRSFKDYVFWRPIFLLRGLFFCFIGVFLRVHCFLQVPVLSSADFLIGIAFF